MRLPNAQNAVVDIRKLKDYCLDLKHNDGKHKARVFRSSLGFTRNDADELQHFLKQAALLDNAQPTELDDYGQRYVIDFLLVRGERQANVRSCWIVRHDEDFPRLTTCYVL